jgi:CRISPR-associated protein Csy2
MPDNNTSDQPYQEAVLVLPQLRVQNANAVSGPMTWGFPAITAFIGLMHALARRLPAESGLEFLGVGVICHDFEAQVTEGGYTRSFRLTRNPVDKDGSTMAIAEEGRIHLDITLVFLVNLAASQWADTARQQLAELVNTELAEMRVAGGSVLPPLPAGFTGHRRPARPQLRLLPDSPRDREKDFKRLSRRWLPGFALVGRDDLLQSHLAKLQLANTQATVLDAWLDLSRLNHRAVRTAGVDAKTGEVTETIEWVTERAKGWIVPIPVGYAALSPLHDAGTVAKARDMATPFRFVEAAYSVGQWVSPHRLHSLDDLLWYGQHEEATGMYRGRNYFADSAPTAPNHTTPFAQNLAPTH